MNISDQSGVPADDSYGGRRPTSHERRAGRPWDASYLDGPAPWDIGEPQPAIVRLAGEGALAGAVLDAGCGTGENALHVASLGLQVLGVDVAQTAVSIARETAGRRGLDAEFVVADALHLDRLGRVFETVLDCGLFHAFDRDERRDYVASAASVTRRGAHLYVLCFSDVGPDACGPHPVGEEELRAAFERSSGWSVASVSPERLQTRFDAKGAPASHVLCVCHPKGGPWNSSPIAKRCLSMCEEWWMWSRRREADEDRRLWGEFERTRPVSEPERIDEREVTLEQRDETPAARS